MTKAADSCFSAKSRYLGLLESGNRESGDASLLPYVIGPAHNCRHFQGWQMMRTSLQFVSSSKSEA
jgi:hypothetical protein